jgi:hypothetical protein
MLSWSSHHAGESADLTAIAEGCTGVGLDHGDELLRYASACGGDDEAELVSARDALVEATDSEFMVDAAAVAANFEMMTRLADATGAALSPERQERSAAAIGAMGIADLTSRR